MSCKIAKCENEIYKYHLCKNHFYSRKSFYKYQGHLADLKVPEVERKCLQCDKIFTSIGNRKCNQCNQTSFDDLYSSVSSFVSCS
jgi:hypothetical protein